MNIHIVSRNEPWALAKPLADNGIYAKWIPNSPHTVDSVDVVPLGEAELVLLMAPDPFFVFSWITRVRARGSRCLIFVIIANGTHSDRATALVYGADEVQSEFVIDDVVARIHALKRRTHGVADLVVTAGDLEIDTHAETVKIRGCLVHFTRHEFLMLELLAKRKGMTVTKEMFLNYLYAGRDEPALKIIDVFVCKIRRKLSSASGGQNFIQTIWGRGHTLADPMEDAA